MKSPIASFGNNELFPGEMITMLNPYTNPGYVINPFYYITSFGRVFSIASGEFKEKALPVNYDGYADIQVSTSAGQKHLLVHRGVLATFAPVPNMYELQVDHIDGNHTNNNLSNLRWVTSSQNNTYAHENGITPTRSRVISDNDIIIIMKLAKDGYSDEEICDILTTVKIAPETVRFIRTGQMIYGEILERLGLDLIVKREHRSLTEEDYAKVLEMKNSGMSASEISEVTGIAGRTVRGIIQRASDRPPVQKKKPTNPIICIPDQYQDLDIQLVNVHTSPLYTLLPVYGVTRDGRMFSMARGKWTEMKIGITDKGYSVVGLVTDQGKKQYFVHRIVLSTFNPIPNMYDFDVNHINGIHNDNRLENLEWISHEENVKHAAEYLINRTPQRAPDEDIIKIVTYAHKGMSDEQISVLMNDKYSPHNVRIIRSGLKTYGPVLEQLNLKPFKYRRGGVTPEEREAIYQYIESRLSTKGLMDLYIDAGNEFDISPETIRGIYGQERSKRK